MEASSQPEFITAATQDDLLDELSLQTVLEMLAVMVTADELTQLESLTPPQKRQVWMATPEDVKVRLRRIKASEQVESHLEQSRDEKKEPEELDQTEELEKPDEGLEEMGAIDDVVSESIDFLNLPLFQNSYGLSNLPVVPVQVGDWVVLKAEPRLTSAELVAVWKVVAIQEEQARIAAKGLGSRQYPMVWMVKYPLEELES